LTPRQEHTMSTRSDSEWATQQFWRRRKEENIPTGTWTPISSLSSS